MPLNFRQQQCYLYTAQIWKPLPATQTGMVADDVAYSPAATYSNVPAMYVQTVEFSPAEVIGETNRDMLFVIDHWRFAVGQDIARNYIIRMAGPTTHPSYGLYWRALGNAKTNPTLGRRQSNSQKVLCYRVPPPPGLTP